VDWNYPKAAGKGPDWAAGYFNECMNGFEYQVAGHMIWEGLVQEGLAVTRAVHDRYHAARRNPWNEVECGDHYARSMASYGVFLAACGFEFHGPKGHLGFAPRLGAENFRAPFVGAEGWGTFGQKRDASQLSAEVELHWGKLRLRTLALAGEEQFRPAKVTVALDGKAIKAAVAGEAGRVMITFAEDLHLGERQKLDVTIRVGT
jgi:non-lysosomal glucosylceramidase